MDILDELNYTLEMPTDGVIESKTEVVLTSPQGTHSPTQNNTIRLYLNGNGFVDPHSISVYADFSTTALASEANVIPPTTYQLFESIRILDGRGNILEEIQGADLLSTHLHNASSSSDFLDCAYGFTNSQKDVSKRVCSPVATNFRLAATDVLGLFAQSKYLHLPSFKGLQLEMRLVSNSAAYSVKSGVATEDAVGFLLENVKLHYTEVQVSRGYIDMYNEKVAAGGYALSFPTYFHLQNSATVGGNQLSLNKTASKVKAIVSVMRENGSRGVLVGKSETAGDSRVANFQYQISGRNYPPEPVSSKSKAFHQLLESNGNRKNNTHSNVCYDDFTSQWAWAAGNKDATASVKFGTYSMWVDLEKSSSSPLSGTSMEANSSFVKVNVEAGVVAPVIDSFVIHERVLSVQPDRIVIVD